MRPSFFLLRLFGTLSYILTLLYPHAEKSVKSTIDLGMFDALEKEDNEAAQPPQGEADDETKDADDDDDGDVEEEAEEEEEAEDETDYGLQYFDNGEIDDLGDEFGD